MKPIYELCPLLYGAMGLWALLALPNTLGKASGLLLLVCALIVVKVRFDYRTEKMRNAKRP